MVAILVDNREGTKQAGIELVVCSLVRLASFAVMIKKEIFEEEQGVKGHAVGLGVHVHAGQLAHHEVAVGDLRGQEVDQGLGRGQHEADVEEVHGRAVGVHGQCQGQGGQCEGGQEGLAGATHEDEQKKYKTSTFLSSPDVAHTFVLNAEGSCEAVRSCTRLVWSPTLVFIVLGSGKQ